MSGLTVCLWFDKKAEEWRPDGFQANLLEGVAHMECSWLTDKYGFAWQIVPEFWNIEQFCSNRIAVLDYLCDCCFNSGF